MGFLKLKISRIVFLDLGIALFELGEDVFDAKSLCDKRQRVFDCIFVYLSFVNLSIMLCDSEYNAGYSKQ